MTEAVATIKGKKLDARYTLLDKLGAGGQGEVWRAHDATRGVDIALKVLNPTSREDEAWSALEHEYAIANLLDHPSILKVFAPERAGEAMVLPWSSHPAAIFVGCGAQASSKLFRYSSKSHKPWNTRMSAGSFTAT